MEKQVWRYGCQSTQTNQAVGGQTCSVQEDRRRANLKHYGSKGRNRKKALRPDEKRELVRYAKASHGMSVHQACGIFGLSETVFYYKAKSKNEDVVIENELRLLAEVQTIWGFWMMFYHLRLIQHKWNHKRVYRVYTDMKLNMRRKYKRRLSARVKEPLLQPLMPNITWSMDFMHDSLQFGKTFRSFNVIDDFNREALNITIDTSLNSKRVIRELNKLIDWRGKPEKIWVDNGPEFIANALNEWSKENGIELQDIQKVKPQQNGYIQRFNRSYRTEILDAFAFDNLKQVRP